MLHTKRPATQKELRPLPEPPKQATRFWEAIGHHDLIQSVLCHTKNGGWKAVVAHLSNDRRDMAASLTVLGPTNYRLGILNSNAMHHQLTFFAGPLVGEEWGLPLTKITLGRHRRGFDLHREVQAALDQVKAASLNFKSEVKRLRSELVNPVEATERLLEAGRNDLMPWSRVGRISEALAAQRLENPRVSNEQLLLSFSDMAKMNPPLRQMQQVYSFYLSLQEKDHGPDHRKLPGD